MRLTLQTDLAFRMLIFLAQAGEEGGAIAEIASAYGVSEHHLRKVANRLVRLGFVESVRGRGGGLRLRVAPSMISLGAVMRQMEPDFALVDCLGSAPGRCPLSGYCGLQRVFREALKAWVQVVDRYTLADVITGSRNLPRLLGLAPPGRQSG
jgi:Rrf2 family transcriptional regulator, nitric oxide-sensitive transcriptional repressor